MKIEVENVRKIQKHRYFSDDNKFNTQLYNKTIILLSEAYKNNSAETLLLMDNNTFNYRCTSQGNSDTVMFDDKMLEALLDINNVSTFTAIHNHPNDGGFSLGDLKQLLIYKKINTLVLITNSCKHSAFLYKTYKLNNNIQGKIITKILNFMIDKDIVNIHHSALRLIQYMQRLGLIYLYYINY